MDSNNTNIVTVNNINSVNPSQLSSMPNLNNIVGIVGNITLSSQSNSRESTLNYFQLQQLLTPGDYLAGMQIINSTISINGGDISRQGPSLPWILGIFIPLAFIGNLFNYLGLIIIGILIYSYLQIKKNPDIKTKIISKIALKEDSASNSNKASFLDNKN